MKKQKSWRIALVVVVGLVLIAAVYIFWPISADVEGLVDAGAAYDVRILRDEWGVPHIFGVTDTDVAYGLAYAHSEDDFSTIQTSLLLGRGKLASIYGADSASLDYLVHLLRIRDTVDEHYESDISPEMKAILEAYADGLNTYAKLHPDEVLPGLFPVTAEDLVAFSVFQLPFFYGLDSTIGELFAEERQNTVSDRSAAWGPLDGLGLGSGSNALAVSPLRSADGETFLAVNSHQPWEGLDAWYEVHLHSEEGWDIAGGLFPTMPAVGHGHNRNLGWAFTVNSPDLADVYVLDINPENPYQYRFDGQWRDLEVREVPIKVKLLGRLSITVKQEALWSVYGPVVQSDHGTYAIRYAGMGEVRIFEQAYRLNKASTLEEWQEAMRMQAYPSFHTIYADDQGNIYYLYNALLPIRSEAYDWSQYLPGDTSETLWTEVLPFEQLPQVLNPAAGFVVNCNSSPFQATLGPENPDPGDYTPNWGIDDWMSNRAIRALELFGADESITEEEFYTYKYDMTYSTESEVARYVERVLDAPLPDDADVQEAVELLRNWDLQANPESTGATIAIWTYLSIGDPLGVDQETLVAGFVEAVRVLKEAHGRVAIPWSEVNRLRRGEVDLGVGGGPDLLHAIKGRMMEDGRLQGYTGDSFVMLVTWDREGTLSSRSIHQFGSATLDETSPHYADQALLFVRRELKPVWMDEADIRAHLEQEYRPGEEIE